MSRYLNAIIWFSNLLICSETSVAQSVGDMSDLPRYVEQRVLLDFQTAVEDQTDSKITSSGF